MQNPHWKAWLSRSASCSGFIVAVERESLDRRDRRAPRLHREHQARAHGLTVEQHGARAAHAVLAPEVGAREAEVLAEEVGERLAGLGGALARAPFTVRRIGIVSVTRVSFTRCLSLVPMLQ